MLAHCGGFQKRAPSPRTTTVNEKKQDITLHVQLALCQRRKNLQGKKRTRGKRNNCHWVEESQKTFSSLYFPNFL